MVSWRLKATLAILLLGLVLTAASAYLIIGQAGDLRRAEERLAASTTAARTIQRNLRSAELDLARKRAQLLVVSDALEANEQLLSRLGSVSRANICPLGQPGLTTRELNLCQLLALTDEPFADFLGRYTATTGKRAAADSSAEFAAVGDSYAALRRFARSAQLTDQWMARIEEGVAYAQYRLDKLEEAQRQIERAAALDPRSAFVGLTTLKIACARHLPEEAIRQIHATQLEALHQSLRSPAPGMDQHFAGLELGYFQNDPELALVCRYARLPSRP